MLTQVVDDRVFDYSHSVGGNMLVHPAATAIGSGDTVYVLMRPIEQVAGVPWNRTGVNAKVGKLTIGTAPGEEEYVSDIGKYGDAEGEFIWPAGLALDGQENVYVTDEWLNRISIFDKESNFLSMWGSPGQGDGELNGPSGIAIDRQENLYIVDSLNHRIQKFTMEGEFLANWGGFGDGEGEFNAPWGVATDGGGNVYVADHKNHRAQKFTSEGELMAVFGSYGTGRGQLNRPSDVAVDPDGDVYVCDWANNRVQVFGPDGEFITTFVGDAQQLSTWHQRTVDANADVAKARRRAYSLEPEWRFALPTGVTFDDEKWRLVVADNQRRRLQIYNKLKGYTEAQFNL